MSLGSSPAAARCRLLLQTGGDKKGKKKVAKVESYKLYIYKASRAGFL
jgi:hypothetical protein